MDKKGLSGVVTTLLLILLGLVAVGVLWVVVANVIEDSSSQVNLDKFTLSLDIESVKYNQNTFDLVLKRNPGKGEIDSMKIIFSDGNYSQTYEVSGIDELQSKLFNVNYDRPPKIISVLPILKNDKGDTTEGTPFVFELTQKQMADIGWVRYSGNPVFSRVSSPSWEDLGVAGPLIVKKLDDSIYKDAYGYWMYYAGMTLDSGAVSLDQFGLARSQDLINWQRVQGTPIMSIGPPGSYDHGDVQVATVLHNGTHFLAWYSSNQYLRAEGGDNVTISFATSVDGINWNRHSGNPILTQGSGGDAGDLYGPLVMYDEGIWKMWYSGHRDSPFGIAFMYATAPAPSGPWTRYQSDYIFSKWRPYNMPLEVYKENGKYYMQYINWTLPQKMKVRLATSYNGINWQDEGVIFDVGAEGSWEDDIVYHTSQAFIDDRWYTFYTGVNENIPNWQTGIATSFVRTPTPIKDY